MLSKEFTGRLRLAHQALWRQDNPYRLAVMAAPVLVVLAFLHPFSGGGNAAAPAAGPPAPPSISTTAAPASDTPKPSAPPPVIKIAPSAALPAKPASSGGYQSPFNQ